MPSKHSDPNYVRYPQPIVRVNARTLEVLRQRIRELAPTVPANLDTMTYLELNELYNSLQ